jgi:type IV pilus assembly protein PilO
MKIGLRELMFFLVLLGMPAASWWFVFKPGSVEIADARGEIDARRQKLDQIQAMSRHINDMGPEIERLTQAINLFEAKVPAEKDVDVIVKQVSQLTSRHGLKSLSLRAEKGSTASRYGEQPLKMKVQGDFTSYYSFLQDIERLARITRVRQMKLVKLKDSEGQMEAEFTLSIFYESQDSGAKVAGVR